MMGFASNIVIGPRVWWRQPTSKLVLKLVPYKGNLSFYVFQIVNFSSHELSILLTLIAVSCMSTNG